MSTVETEWLTYAHVATLMNIRVRDVRMLVADHQLASRMSGKEENSSSSRAERGELVIPRDFFIEEDGDFRPLPSLRGTLTQLADLGLTDSESISWLLNEDALLGESPLDALHHGRAHEVRRMAFTAL